MRILVSEKFHIPGNSENKVMSRSDEKPGASSVDVIETNEYPNDGLVITQTLVRMVNLVSVEIDNIMEHKILFKKDKLL